MGQLYFKMFLIEKPFGQFYFLIKNVIKLKKVYLNKEKKNCLKQKEKLLFSRIEEIHLTFRLNASLLIR